MENNGIRTALICVYVFVISMLGWLVGLELAYNDLEDRVVELEEELEEGTTYRYENWDDLTPGGWAYIHSVGDIPIQKVIEDILGELNMEYSYSATKCDEHVLINSSTGEEATDE